MKNNHKVNICCSVTMLNTAALIVDPSPLSVWRLQCITQEYIVNSCGIKTYFIVHLLRSLTVPGPAAEWGFHKAHSSFSYRYYYYRYPRTQIPR